MRWFERRPRHRQGSTEDELASRLVWILGSPRSGSTWLLNLLRSDPRIIGLDEPSIGAHLAIFLYGLNGLQPDGAAPERMRLNDFRSSAPDYFFSARYEAAWRPLTRRLILGRLAAQVGDGAPTGSAGEPLVAIKEPHGSIGADLLMSLLPESRLLFLLRDGRDVVDSELDAATAGSWAMERLEGYAPADRDRLAFIGNRAHAWLGRTAVVERAYDTHPPELRMLVRYEDLRRDPEAVLASLFDWLGLGLADGRIAAMVRELDFERMERRGSGEFARAASPGLWRQNLSSSERELLERIVGPKLRELGYA